MPCASSSARRTDARQHQQLRRVECAAGKDHFARGACLPALAGGCVRLRVRAVEPFALQVLDANRALRVVEQDAGREGIELESSAIRVSRLDVEEPFASADAAMVVGRQRRVADADRALGHAAPVVGILLAVEPRRRSANGPPTDSSASFADLMIVVRRLRSVNAAFGIGLFGRQPARPAMAARVAGRSC